MVVPVQEFPLLVSVLVPEAGAVKDIVPLQPRFPVNTTSRNPGTPAPVTGASVPVMQPANWLLLMFQYCNEVALFMSKSGVVPSFSLNSEPSTTNRLSTCTEPSVQ